MMGAHMTTIATVVCPVDRSPVSKHALALAVTLAKQHHARLKVFEVLGSTAHEAAGGHPLFELHPEARTALEEELNWFAAPLLDHDVPTEISVREGRVVPEILAVANQSNAPAIVIGTHGRGGIERLILGSVTERVVRKAPCLVVAVPPVDHGHDSTAGVRRVVVAVDFSDGSVNTTRVASLLATPPTANLSLLHVLDWPFGETTGPDAVTTLRESLEADARDQLDHVATTAAVRIAERVVRRGHPSREILQFARERQASLIVVGSSGAGAVGRAVLGTTAHRVLREAPCPVAIVPVGAVDTVGVGSEDM